MNPIDEYVDQAKAAMTMSALTIKGRKTLVRAIIKAERFMGNTQYPRTQTDWKNETLPPRNFAFRVTTKPPIQIIKNIVPKITSLSFFDEKLTVKANARHKINGPQRSPNGNDYYMRKNKPLTILELFFSLLLHFWMKHSLELDKNLIEVSFLIKKYKWSIFLDTWRKWQKAYKCL